MKCGFVPETHICHAWLQIRNAGEVEAEIERRDVDRSRGERSYAAATLEDGGGEVRAVGQVEDGFSLGGREFGFKVRRGRRRIAPLQSWRIEGKFRES